MPLERVRAFRCRRRLEDTVTLDKMKQKSCSANGAQAPKYPVFDGRYVKLPGFIDVHVHLREPGFSYKETVASGTLAAARGGYSAVCCMPNLAPVPDCDEHLKVLEDMIAKNARVRVYPYASITVGEKGEEIVDFAALKGRAIAFSDDGKGVQSEDVMRLAMTRAKNADVILAAHCEVNSLLAGGYIHDGEYALKHGHKGISSESEWKEIERDLRLAGETGAKFHVCHISTKESVQLIREAKARGVDVTCETAPHYLLLDDSDIKEDGRFKMNPPLRSKEDRLALLEGLRDGTIDMVATDHAPHSAEEKSRGLKGSLMGVVGLETAFPALYTGLVKEGVISLERLVELMCYAPAKRFGIAVEGEVIWDVGAEYKIDPNDFCSMGRATPFEGKTVFGKCISNELRGQLVWKMTEK